MPRRAIFREVGITEPGTTGSKVRVEVSRSDPGARGVFEVERAGKMTLLDLLLAIQRGQDSSLGFRYSCRVGMCNVCGLRADGKCVLACREPLGDDGREIHLEPLHAASVVRDLVCETDQFVDEWARDTAG